MKDNKNRFEDPPNVEEIKKHLTTLKTLADVKTYIDEILPNWFITVINDYSEDYSSLSKNWDEVCKKANCKKTQILIVEELSHEPNFSLILLLAELFTRSGFAVRRKYEFIPCKVCGKAIATQYVWNILKNNGENVPEVWSDKCINC